ncbi:MAG TPA: FAD-dependent thymidylate synthase [Actinomycetota bacterium]|nr:FAD-dependent thymidylate synthase [Actinomycetota bacterium]
MLEFVHEEFSDEERRLLAPYVTNLDGPVFALANLSETVKGALFARYSRSPKSLRRLFLDEFAEPAERSAGAAEAAVGERHAEELYGRIFFEYGDDSVAQLGGVHLACEQASQLLGRVLERGRLAAYLEQSTRYVPYDDRPAGRWRFRTPSELEDTALAAPYRAALDRAFETYARWLGPLQAFFRERFPRQAEDSDFVYRMTIRAKACDTLRGLLPAATVSNVGIFATGQSYEHLLLRMRAHPLREVREYGDLMLVELRKVIPAFLRRVDLEGRGMAWSRYLEERRKATAERAETFLADVPDPPRPLVTLTDFDPDGELKVTAACLYEETHLPDDVLLERVRALSAGERGAILSAAVGTRENRRHRPGRAFERTGYRFEVLCDYGAFRDLQRHRPLTIQWQELTPRHGYETPPEVDEAGARAEWDGVMAECADLSTRIREAGLGPAAQYPVPMAHRIRFVMQMNAREAMHLIELRSSPQGHPAYRSVAHELHRMIGEVAGHRGIAAAMRHVDRSAVDLERLAAERRTDERRRARRAGTAGSSP